MDRTWSGVTLVAFLVVAGCAGTGLPADDLTVTPAPIPTDPMPTPVFRLAPGLSEDGVIEPFALTSAHVEVLHESTYRVYIEERIEPTLGGPFESRLVVGTVANRTHYRLLVLHGVESESQYERRIYADTNARYVRLVLDTEPRYYVPRPELDEESSFPYVPIGRLDQRQELYNALIASDPAYEGTQTINGTAFHRVVATEASDPRILAAWNYADAVTDFEFEALVAPDGHVHEFRVTYVVTKGDEHRRVHRVARWTAVGNATVTAPEWYEEARERTGD